MSGEKMKRGVTPSNYKDLIQERLVADIFKTPDQRLQNESSGEVQFNTETISGGGRRESAADFFRLAEICSDVYTSWENCYTKTFITTYTKIFITTYITKLFIKMRMEPTNYY
jgi:hypothetical protein